MSAGGQQGGTRGPGSGMAAAFVPAGIAVAVLVGALWVTGTVGALLIHGQRPGATLSDMGAVAVRLVRHPGEPAAAWPAPDQRLIPGPAGFYATLLGVACLAGGLAILGWRGWRRVEAVLPGSDDYGAAWATRGDLRDLAVRKRTDLTGRIVLGRTTWRQTIASTLRHSLLLFGPTLSGKTTSFVIPTVLRWRGPVIATSSKVDMLLATITARERRGRVYLLYPFRAPGIRGRRWPRTCWRRCCTRRPTRQAPPCSRWSAGPTSTTWPRKWPRSSTPCRPRTLMIRVRSWPAARSGPASRPTRAARTPSTAPPRCCWTSTSTRRSPTRRLAATSTGRRSCGGSTRPAGLSTTPCSCSPPSTAKTSCGRCSRRSSAGWSARPRIATPPRRSEE